jgi:predicted phage baseplate assembly protein
MSGVFTCPCDGPTDTPPRNAPGLSTIAYRDTTYAAIRRALLTPQPGETELTAWRPGAAGDLAVMMAEWWAYLGDILTFYNERIANEVYLRTAKQPASVCNLAGVLGYRPQPGVGATATLAALVQPGPSYGVTTTLPADLQVNSKPVPGQSPQTFELAQATPIGAPDVVTSNPQLALSSPDPNTILLAGSVSSIVGGAYLLLRPRDGGAPSLVQVASATIVTLPSGAKQTSLTVTVGGTADGPAAVYRLDKPGQSAMLWNLPGAAIDATGTVIQLSGLVRTINLGDWVLLTVQGGSPVLLLTTVVGVTDVVWDENGNSPTKDSTGVFPHTQIKLHDGLALPSGTTASDVTVYFGWTEAAQLVDQPQATWPAAGATTPATLVATTPFGAVGPNGVLIADATGAGVIAQATVSSDYSTLSVSGLGDPPPSFQTPLSVMFNLLPMTRGKTVPLEILGSGDPTVPNQSFKLAKSPLTYLRQGANLVSTLTITVNGQIWTEVPTLYDQPSDGRVYVTSQDANQVTKVQFGDGVNGARLPAGSGNVVATYRFGSGFATPPAGTLTVIASPYPGLRAVRNPLAAGGGADPDPPDKIQTYAPRSVLTFGRAVSAPDFLAIAAMAAGGVRVGAGWAWNPANQRGAVTIYLADTGTTLADVTKAFAQAGDPNRPVFVVPATKISVFLGIEMLIAPNADGPTVQNGVIAALTDPSSGLFSAQKLGIGQSVFDSQIAAACQGVPGFVAIAAMLFYRQDAGIEASHLHIPPEGAYFELDPSDLYLLSQVAANG